MFVQGSPLRVTPLGTDQKCHCRRLLTVSLYPTGELISGISGTNPVGASGENTTNTDCISVVHFSAAGTREGRPYGEEVETGSRSFVRQYVCAEAGSRSRSP